MNADTAAFREFSRPRLWLRMVLFLILAGLALVTFLEPSRSSWYYSLMLMAAAVFVVTWPVIVIARRRVSPLLLAVVGFAACSVAMETLLPPTCDAHTAKSAAETLIQQLDAYRAAKGRFPKDLAEAGITPPRFRGGVAFKYALGQDGHCSLWIGNYNLDGFAAIWGSKDREWWVDS